MRLTRQVASAVVLVPLATAWVVKLIRLKHSVATYAEHWSKPRGHDCGLLYVALGDSAAQGIGAGRPGNGYVALIARRMRQTTGRTVQVVNLSRSGARIDDALHRQLPVLATLDRRPDVVTVAIGGNDVRAYDRDTFEEQAERLAAALPPGAYVADAPYFMHGRWEAAAQHAADQLQKSATARDLRPVALSEALRAQGWRAMLTQFAADWFHPNDRGHRVWADAFWDRIRADPSLHRPA